MKQNLKEKLVGGLLAMLFAFSPAVLADDASGAQMATMVNNMQKQMNAMQQTIDAQNRKIGSLENRAPAAGGTGAAEATPPMSDYEFGQRLDTSLGGAQKWLKDLSFKGDMRLRYEAIHFKSGQTPSASDDRNRFRYRLRFGWEKKFSEDLKVGFGLASGEPQGTTALGDNVSTNTTLDQNFAFKQIFVEKVYASWNPAFLRGGVDSIFKNTNITAGKFDNPFEKGTSDMIWDRDVKPEGIYEKFDLNLYDGENVDLTAYGTSGQFILDEDATNGGDSELFAYQGGLNSVMYTPFMERPVEWLGAFSFYDYVNYARHSNFAVNGARGNTNGDGNAAELDVGSFKVVEAYNEIAFAPFGVPIRPFYDVAYNEGAQSPFSNNALAWGLGTKVGGIVKNGDWEVGYTYKSIEPDSVPGGFNDSDFGAVGHSGHHGSVFKAGYGLMDTVTLNLSAYFVNNLATGTAGVADEAQQRFQTDLVWKF